MLTAVKTKYPWEIEKNYRRCFAKSYKVHVCRPPRGVVIYNKLEHPELLSQLEGQSCITLKLQEKPILAELALTLVKEHKAYCMNGDNFVILGTQGEMYPISKTSLFKLFCRHNGMKITASYLSSKYDDESYIDWFEAYSVIPDTKTYACHLPVSKQGIFMEGSTKLYYNADGVKHGRGDFIISEMTDEGNFIGKKRLVNGLVFADTFVTRNWQECVSPNYSERRDSTQIYFPVLYEGY